MKSKKYHQRQKFSFLTGKTYLAMLKNSVGSKLFRKFYVKTRRKKVDILNNGKLSCAFYVSSILYLFKLIKNIHFTVDSTVKDLQKSGWEVVKKPKVGSVIVWEKMDFGDGDIHKHIGFYIGDGKAISNSSKFGYPVKHSWPFRPKRKVEIILWNPKLKID
ncbi:MAG: hypothetical protein ACP5IX_01395 [Patescibacteria group bacterium]